MSSISQRAHKIVRDGAVGNLVRAAGEVQRISAELVADATRLDGPDVSAAKAALLAAATADVIQYNAQIASLVEVTDLIERYDP